MKIFIVRSFESLLIFTIFVIIFLKELSYYVGTVNMKSNVLLIYRYNSSVPLRRLRRTVHGTRDAVHLCNLSSQQSNVRTVPFNHNRQPEMLFFINLFVCFLPYFFTLFTQPLITLNFKTVLSFRLSPGRSVLSSTKLTSIYYPFHDPSTYLTPVTRFSATHHDLCQLRSSQRPWRSSQRRTHLQYMHFISKLSLFVDPNSQFTSFPLRKIMEDKWLLNGLYMVDIWLVHGGFLVY